MRLSVIRRVNQSITQSSVNITSQDRIIVIRVVQPFGNHFEDIDPGYLEGVIDETDLRISDTRKGKLGDRNLRVVGLDSKLCPTIPVMLVAILKEVKTRKSGLVTPATVTKVTMLQALKPSKF